LKSAALGAAVGAMRPLAAFAQAPAAPAAPASATTLPDEKQFPHLKVGICSYSLRSIPAAEALPDIQRLGVRNFSLKDVHLAQTSTPEQRRDFRQQAEQLGLTIHSCGVIYMKNDEAEMRKAFDYVKDLGAPVIVVGVSKEMLPTLDKVIKNYDIKAAIHNHGPNDKLFPSPLEIYDAIQPFDKKIGVCMDIGHTFRMHEDLVADAKKMHDRLYSLHFKDLESGDIKAKGVPVGTGVLPIVPLLKELVSSNYAGEVQLEYEVDVKDPLPGSAESLGFIRGVLQSI
jgi:sugar phosphate isomerase/epimerase